MNEQPDLVRQIRDGRSRGLRLLAAQGLVPLIDLEVSRDFLLQRALLIVLFGVVVGAAGSAISLGVHRHIRT